MEASTEKRPYHRRVANVAPDPTIEPMEMQCGQDNPRLMRSDGPASESLEPALIEPVEVPLGAVDQEKLAVEKFMQDELSVYMHTSNHPADAQTFEIWVNGKVAVFTRGQETKCKRYFVANLASRKTTTYTQQEEYIDGVRHFKQIPHTALTYPFAVRHDPHPRGADWLRFMLAEA